MSVISIYYLLGEEGRRKAFLRGQDAQQLQVLEADVPLDDPEFVKLIKVTPMGKPYIAVGCSIFLGRDGMAPAKVSWRSDRPIMGYVADRTESPQDHTVSEEDGPYVKEIRGNHEFDQPMTVDQLFAWERERAKRLAMEKETAEQQVDAARIVFNQKLRELRRLRKMELWEWVRGLAPEHAALPEVIELMAVLDSMVTEDQEAAAEDALYAVKKKQQQQETEIRRTRLEEELKEASRWSQEHGSARLRRIAEEGLLGECLNVYQEERLKKERPGWRWKHQVSGSPNFVRNPPLEAFDILDEARKTEPSAMLRFWCIPHVCTILCRHGKEGIPKYDWTGYAATAVFLGKEIVYGGPYWTKEKN